MSGRVFLRKRSLRGRGFTLVELLVVVAIIALLISILLPSLARAREQAKTSKCLANLRDMLNASVAYSNSEPSEYLIPLTPMLKLKPHISAARRAWGGKSGRHMWNTAPDPDFSPTAQIFSTRAGLGPHRRPLNTYLYRSSFRNYTCAELNSLPLAEGQQDEKLSMEVFRCPSDVGYQDAKDGEAGIFLYGSGVASATEFGREFKDQTPLYDVAGNSYATDSLLTTGGSAQGNVISWGSFLRPYSQIPEPSVQYVYLDGNGFYACFWNQASLGVSIGGANDLEAYTWGWHGENRVHNASYADGHAAPTKFEIRTDANGFDSGLGRVVHNGTFDLRGGSAHDFDYSRGDSANTWMHHDAAAFCLKGDGWKNHSQPAPATWTPGILQDPCQ